MRSTSGMTFTLLRTPEQVSGQSGARNTRPYQEAIAGQVFGMARRDSPEEINRDTKLSFSRCLFLASIQTWARRWFSLLLCTSTYNPVASRP